MPHLWPLLRVDSGSDEELKEKYREIFISTYVQTPSGDKVVITDWKGNRVRFSSHIFEHAFSEATDYRFGGGIHDVPFSRNRARRMLWIKETLAASAGTIERRHQLRKDSRGRPKKRRILIVVEEKYIVVLEETGREKELNFISAFPADTLYIEKIRQESTLMETKKPQS